jgi:uridine phosphorylase
MLLGEIETRKALLAFLPVGEMEAKFLVKKGKPMLLSHYWRTWIREDGVILAGPIFGGPMCAAVLEELSVLGVRDVIGYGYSGTLDPEIPPASIMVADSSFCSDGTSREYCEESEVYADARLLDYLGSVITKRGIKLESGKVWTTDAIYREIPSRVRYWKEKGAKFVNVETASLYSVARVKGLRAAYISIVSDSLVDGKWSGWFDCKPALEQVWNICLDTIETI